MNDARGANLDEDSLTVFEIRPGNAHTSVFYGSIGDPLCSKGEEQYCKRLRPNRELPKERGDSAPAPGEQRKGAILIKEWLAREKLNFLLGGLEEEIALGVFHGS